jgi:hypothetical protein
VRLAASGHVISSPVRAAVEQLVEVEPLGDLHLKGFHWPGRITSSP